MRSEIQHHLLLSLSEDHGVCESRKTRADFDGSTSSVIQDTVFVGPSVDVPWPTCEWAVDECRPEENENHCWDETATLSDGAHDNCSSDSRELELDNC